MKKPFQSKNIISNPISSKGWENYALLDSGNQRKLERFGERILDRFEPEATWKPASGKSEWARALAVYLIDQKNGKWIKKGDPNPEWSILIDDISIALQISASRHIGIFPEQVENWRWMFDTITSASQPINVLNLFAYTGVASLFCAKAGAEVTHVDASRSAIEMGKSSQVLSMLDKKPIRWIVDDVHKFMLREIRRGNSYNAIIMDPPKFGRGPKGEIWKFEASIDGLLAISEELLTDNPLFFILTSYNIELKDVNLANKICHMMRNYHGNIEYGPLIQLEHSAGRKIEQAQYVRWKHIKHIK